MPQTSRRELLRLERVRLEGGVLLQPLVRRVDELRQALHFLLHLRAAMGGGGRQVVSLGAGVDTLFFRLQSSALLSPADVVYEVDFPALVRRKLALIVQDPTIAELCG